jgi:cell division protein FtsI/penicillin-binding protein 2
MLPVDQWSGTTIGTVPIGQGVSVTALQMLEAYNVIANGGRWVPPRLVRATVDRQGEEHAVVAGDSRSVVSEATARTVTGMLADVVRTGTGVNAAVEGYTVAGKTGTARKPKEGARGYASGKYVASFAGFVPAEDPRLSIIVMLDEPFPIYGGTVAAPVFSNLAAYALRHLRIPPPLAPPPADPPDTLVLDAEANDARVRGEAAPIPTTVAPGAAAAIRPDGG